MILVDFSAVMHQMLFSSLNMVKPKKDPETHKFITSEYINVTKYKILEELFNIQTKFSSRYKDIVLCMDNYTAKNWRRDVLGSYKINRHKEREGSEINFSEVYTEIDELVNQLDENSPWKVVNVERAEGDDCILSLAKYYATIEPILIISFDKDMIQAQKYGNVKQYNQLTGKYVTSESRHTGNIDEWLVEHVCLGDSTDDVPRITDNLRFSINFKEYLKDNNKNISEFDFAKLPYNDKLNIIGTYGIYVKDKSGNDTDKLDLFDKPRFGPSSLKKKIEEYNGLDNWLNTNPLLKYNYELNQKLILGDFIPDKIRNNIINTYKNAKCIYKDDFRKYLESEQMGNILSILPTNFSDNSEISVEDLLW